MKNLLFFFDAMLSAGATSAYAAEASKFRCDDVGGNEEWVIYVDLEKHKAGFFDNDDMVVVDFAGTVGFECTTCPVTYLFEGDDTNGGSDGGISDRLRISFVKYPVSTQRPTASVT